MFAGLSLDQAPPFSAPLRFFLTAPLAAFAGTLLLLFSGPGLFGARWSFEAFAVVHLFTLGFITMTMMGAMQQMLPVLIGVTINRALERSRWIHALYSLGLALFVIGFYFNIMYVLSTGVGLLTIAIGWFLFLTGKALFKDAKVKNHTLLPMRLSWISLVMVLLLGMKLALARAGWYSLPYHLEYTEMHLTWALLGWVGLLVMGVGFQVIPMFYLAPEFPTAWKRWLPWSLFAWLWGYTLLQMGAHYIEFLVMPYKMIRPIGAIFPVVFAAMALNVLRKRKRRLFDTGLAYWLVFLFTLPLISLMWIGLSYIELSEALLGMAVLLAIVALIHGMLYKIVPFLAWFHLMGTGKPDLPGMKQLLTEQRSRSQFYLWSGAVVLLLASHYLAPLFYPATVLFAVAELYMFWNLLSAARHYFRLLQG